MRYFGITAGFTVTGTIGHVNFTPTCNELIPTSELYTFPVTGTNVSSGTEIVHGYIKVFHDSVRLYPTESNPELIAEVVFT